MSDLYRWIPCDDYNYWTDEEGYATIIQVDSYIFTRDSCPYGWNVLCKNNAKLMNIKL